MYNYIASLLVLLAIAKTGSSLQCWTCDSEQDYMCADYFNTTDFYRSFPYNPQRQVPSLTTCPEAGNVYLNNQKPVCVKQKQSYSGSNRVTTIRQCKSVPRDAPMGTCPPTTTGSGLSIDFCEICDRDGCNGASTMGMSLIATILPAALLLVLLRK